MEETGLVRAPTNTSIQVPKETRDRLRIVAAKQRCTMMEWIKRKVTEDEKAELAQREAPAASTLAERIKETTEEE